MNIGVDIDGVLTNIQDYVFEYGSKFSYEKEKDLSNLEKNKYETAEIFNWQHDEEQKFWEELFAEYAEHERPRFFASEVLNILKEKHNIYIITARTNDGLETNKPEIEKITKTWLKKQNIPYDGIYFPGTDKSQIVKDKKIDVMIEDSAENISLLEGKTNIIVFDAIYNKEAKGYARVNSWYEILYYINKLEKELNAKKEN